ncbi:pyruvate dehydrogenase protein X component-like [Saccoglossus kowalevskii]|uniref:Dihydrolipoamide acetyltransferase component of pyruvate dehydrogenase complex n=1 Tax=Saccoglossus kowalevskii TaxID=10224 RepID=A0ABM0MXD5_SACKO|nr:PREDICTED: pyruvate dehydrogenase protein X component-like [Saccoglossus kowalevskii]
MPALSPTMEVGTIVKWLKKEGDTVHPGDYLCDIETDKNVNSMDTEEEGILAKILVAEGTSNVAIGSLIALIVEEGSDYRNVQIPAEAGPSAPSSGEVTVPDASTSTAQAADNKSSTLLSPAVRVLLEQHNLNINDIIGSGHHGRVLKGDLLKVVAGDKTLIRISKPASIDAKPKSPGDITVASPKSTTKPISTTPPTLPSKNTFTDLELNNMRKTIARRLLESKQSTPHAYATVDCRMDEVLQLRKNLAKENVKVSVNDFLIKAIAVTLKNVPEVNATWAGDSVKFLQNIDISVAVATPNGLITPIVKSAASKGLMDISNDIKDLASRAREGKLQLDEFQGGSFT